MIGRDTPYIDVDDSDDDNSDDDNSRHRIFTDDEDDSGYGDMSTRASPLASTVGSEWAAEALQWGAGSGPNGHLCCSSTRCPCFGGKGLSRGTCRETAEVVGLCQHASR